jgi:excisionase family DNA binding protein
MAIPDWAAGIDRAELDELGREDLALRAIEAAAPLPATRGPLAEWSTTEQVAAYIKRSPKTIRRYIKEGRLKAKGSKHEPYRIHKSEVERLMMRKQEKPRSGSSGRGSSPRPRTTTFKDLVKKDGR